MQRPFLIYAAIVIFLAFASELAAVRFSQFPSIELSLVVFQVGFLLVALFAHPFVEVCFWRFPLKKLAFAEGLGFLLILVAVGTALFFSVPVIYVLSTALGILTIRAMILFRCRYL